jgi:hypothetical protein
VRTLTGKDLVQRREGTASLVQNNPALRERFAGEADQAFLESSLLPAGFFSYIWYSSEYYEDAPRRVRGALVAAQAGLPATFFTAAARDMYDHDRALWAADAVGGRPLRKKDIPSKVVRTVKRYRVEYDSLMNCVSRPCYEDDTYALLRFNLEWHDTVSSAAIEASGKLIEYEPPDRFWIAKYMLPGGRTLFSAIYAEYGDWQVEVARWT